MYLLGIQENLWIDNQWYRIYLVLVLLVNYVFSLQARRYKYLSTLIVFMTLVWYVKIVSTKTTAAYSQKENSMVCVWGVCGGGGVWVCVWVCGWGGVCVCVFCLFVCLFCFVFSCFCFVLFLFLFGRNKLG